MASNRPLTTRQEEVLRQIRIFITEHRVAPTNRELGEALGGMTQNSVRDHLRALVRKGYIEIVPRVSRGIRLVAPLETDRESELRARVEVLEAENALLTARYKPLEDWASGFFFPILDQGPAEFALERIGALERKLSEHTRPFCWHCLDVLEPIEQPKHCERCPPPGDCDEADCDAPGHSQPYPWDQQLIPLNELEEFRQSLRPVFDWVCKQPGYDPGVTFATNLMTMISKLEKRSEQFAEVIEEALKWSETFGYAVPNKLFDAIREQNAY